MSADSLCAVENIAILHDLYPKECLIEAVKQFSPFCEITVIGSHETESVINISAKPKETLKAEEIVGEFMNYLLDLSCRFFLASARLPSKP
jgi:hypothetical protein